MPHTDGQRHAATYTPLTPHIGCRVEGIDLALPMTDEEFARERRSTLLNRGPTPDEIAATVRFILDAPAMTGQMIALDGGQHLTWATDPAAAPHEAAPRPRR